MKLAIDTYYSENQAKTVCISFDNWDDSLPSNITEEFTKNFLEYEPGAFYKRELPCILSILDQFDIEKIDVIIVDSYVLLNDAGKLGLGGHLYEAINKSTPIIGVAKSKFKDGTKFSKEILRGGSKKPLFISAIGIDLEEAANSIRSMHGEYRFPTLLQILDGKTKEKK